MTQNLFSLLATRGPDEQWMYQDDSFRALATRLSIVRSDRTLADSNDPNARVVVLLNGEIWNYEILANRLGLVFPQDSEIDVVRAAYLRYGEQFSAELDGMYAIVIADLDSKTLLVCRDEYGIKPVFYSHQAQSFCVASTVASIAVDQGQVELNQDFVANMGVFGFSDYENCIVKGVRQVTPGTTIVAKVRSNIVTVETVPIVGKPLTSASTLTSTQEDHGNNNSWDLLRTATKKCIGQGSRKNRVAVLLSGGIDSAAICACIAELGLENSVDAFFAGPKESADEKYATLIADRLGLNLTRIRPDLSFEFNHFEQSALQLGGYPAIDLLSLFRQLRHARPEHKVVICGEGADELYGGYPWHSNPEEYLLGFLDRSLKSTTQSTRLERLLIGKIRDALGDSKIEMMAELTLEIDRGLALVERHLVPFDHASMAYGFEVRVPYIDSEHARNVKRTPSILDTKIRKAELKNELRTRIPGLPDDFFNRPKIGFPNAFKSEFLRLGRNLHTASVVPDSIEADALYSAFLSAVERKRLSCEQS